MEGDYAIRRFIVGTSGWTPIIPPIDCSSFSFRCDTDVIYERTDPDNADSEDVLNSDIQEYVPGAAVRWKSGFPITYVRAKTLDNQVVIAKFVR